jgi:hypothetical protein
MWWPEGDHRLEWPFDRDNRSAIIIIILAAGAQSGLRELVCENARFVQIGPDIADPVAELSLVWRPGAPRETFHATACRVSACQRPENGIRLTLRGHVGLWLGEPAGSSLARSEGKKRKA